MRALPSFLIVLTVAAAALAPASAAAQAVRGQLSDENTSAPIADAALRLVAPDNSTVATARTDSLGEFFLPFDGAGGTYRIRAEKVGYRPAISSPLSLEESDTLDVHVKLVRQIVLLRRARPARRRRGPW